ncbi:MAG: type II toxin-antitoxin system VapB family antitoxin [Actinomycetaceae bacterium]
MRTTVNIDDELLAAAKLRAARTHQTIGSVLEEALRRLLHDPEPTDVSVTLPDFGYGGGLQPGVDLYDRDGMARILGETSR